MLPRPEPSDEAFTQLAPDQDGSSAPIPARRPADVRATADDDLTVEVWMRGRETEVRVTMEDVSTVTVGTGIARCRPDDHYDPSVGAAVALGRALVDLGQQVEESGLRASTCEVDHLAAQVTDTVWRLAEASRTHRRPHG